MTGQLDLGETLDVLVVGGGASGLSAALVLARARRCVLVVDAGEPRNAAAGEVHGLLGHEDINPLELLTRGRAEVSHYGGRTVAGRVVDAASDPRGFVATLDSGERIRARVMVIASGAIDVLPDIPGLRERWGREVVHCSYCHGWEIRDSRIGVLASDPSSPMQALMFRQWSSDVRYFSHDTGITEAEVRRLSASAIPVNRSEITGFRILDDRLIGVVLEDGGFVELDALVVTPSSRPRLEGLERLGLKPLVSDSGPATIADHAGRTSVPGVWATGNVVQPGLQLSEAIGHGARVAMTINTELTIQDANRLISAAATSAFARNRTE